MINHQYTIAITLKTDNACFEDEGPEIEVRRILTEAIEKAINHMSLSDIPMIPGVPLRDLYGNTVGTLTLTGAPTN